MDILLTGATGYVGSHILTALTDAGHTVTAVVRSEEAAAKVKSDTVNAVIGAVTDETFLVEALRRADGAIHAAAPGGDNPTVAELTEAAARAAGAPGVIAETDDAARNRLGPYLAEALLLDQQATAARARSVLGWTPHGPSLLHELEFGSYARPV